MPVQPLNEVLAALSDIDRQSGTFTVGDVDQAVRNAVKDLDSLAQDARNGWWAEFAAFDFSTHETPDGGPWKTHFQPLMSATQQDGTPYYSPDLRDADADVIAYWSARAKEVTHPVLVARYADLVWDTTKFVTKGKPGVEFARIAIDAYVSASTLDDGSCSCDTHSNLGRALRIALSIRDSARIDKAVEATIAYVDRTADEAKIGTYCYLMDNLLPPGKGPELSEDQERRIVGRFEATFAKMTTPGGKWDADPYGVQSIGSRIAAYYQRKGRREDSKRVLRAIGAAFERRAGIGDALTGMVFLDDARRLYLEAGSPEDAERVQRAGQDRGPEAEKSMAPLVVKHEVSKKELEQFLDVMTAGTVEETLVRFTLQFIPDQKELAHRVAEMDKKFPLQALFQVTLLGHGHIEANVKDDAGDPDGKTVYETSRHIQLHAAWIGWTWDRLIGNGLTAALVAEFVARSPLFTKDRLPLIQRGMEAHIVGDYTQAIHVLIPQTERALVNLVHIVGKPSNKPHRTGRGVMQSKNLNDVLARDEWPVPGDDSEDLRLYLLASLAHPKGMNIRNEVCHGLLPATAFSKTMSERVLHAMLAVSLLRPQAGPEDSKSERDRTA